MTGKPTNPRSLYSPLISIIIPVFHVEKYLERCLNSVLNQSYPNFELILINDGGNAEETEICEDYARKDPRIIYTHQANSGLSAARNTGLDVCHGEWIMFVDSDDWVSSKFCEAAVNAVMANEADMGIFDLAYVKESTSEEYIHASTPPVGLYNSREILKERLSGGVSCYAWNKIYHHTLWNGIRFPIGENWEDDAIIHELIDTANHIVVLHDVLYYKLNRNDCITEQAFLSGEDCKWLFMQRKRRYQFLKENHPDLLACAEADTAKATMLYGMYRTLMAPDKEEYDKAREWALTEKLSLANQGFVQRIALFSFLHCKPLFHLIARIWHMKRRAKHNAQRSGLL